MPTTVPPAASPTHTDSSDRTMAQHEREERAPASSFSDDSDVDTEIEFEPIHAEDDLEFEEGPLEQPVPTSQVSTDPLPLRVPGLGWADVDLRDPKQMQEVRDFTILHYVQDDEEPYRFDFSAECLKWALMPPEYYPDWHIVLRKSETQEIVGFIAGFPLKIRIRQNILQTCAISFLCVHREWRGQHLAAVMMSELSRRAQLRDVHQHFYTTGTTLPRMVSTSQYYHRCLNFAQLHKIGYVAPPAGVTVDDAIAYYKLPDHTSVPGLREMREDDIPAVTQLWADFSKRYSSAAVLSEREMRHYLLSSLSLKHRKDGRSMFAFVVEAQDESRAITDFVSFYVLKVVALEQPNDPSRTRRILDSAHLYYYASTSTASDELLAARLNELIADALVVAQREELDGFNCMSIMDNCLFCAQHEPLKFHMGTGLLKWYLENYRVHPLAGRDATADAPPGRGIGVIII